MNVLKTWRNDSNALVVLLLLLLLLLLLQSPYPPFILLSFMDPGTGLQLQQTLLRPRLNVRFPSICERLS